MSYRARFEWGYDGIKTHGQVSDILVIIDVLSFTTCVDVVLGQGGIVYPYRTKGDSALAFARKQDAILAGKRGEPISLSPASLHSIKWGSRIVLPSPNGSTCSVLAKDCGAIVLAGCLRNAKAIARFIQQHKGSVSVIACGERWPDGSLRPALEDLVAAGAILSELSNYDLSPEAEAAVATFSASQYKLESLLEHSVSGQELIVRGYPDDVHLAAMLNVSQNLPLLNHHMLLKTRLLTDDRSTGKLHKVSCFW
ncbi:2-phosphosulfolactate phosphatase [Brevibacillus invocatus]|nr:2-phosphosulfolactate phosphatase [Brevibacillus invocatus]